MYYDQLKAYRHELVGILKLIISDYSIPEIEKEEQITMVLSRLKKVDKKLDAAKKEIGRYPSTNDPYEASVFKKKVKHEFLTQAKDGYSVNEIIDYIKANIENPGVNVEKYIEALRVQDGRGGYFVYGNVTGKDSEVWLTDKAERYLENEANVSLRR